MRLEHIPLILGVIVALIGLGFIADASMAASAPVTPERRRRTRAEPSRAGEAVVGIGTLCMAAALFGRDTWRYGTVAVLIGSVLLLAGVILNRAFLKEALLFRGPARRSEGGVPAARPRPGAPTDATGPRAGAPVAGSRAAEQPAGTRRASAATVRHPTPPVASRAYQPPGQAAPDGQTAGSSAPSPGAPRPASPPGPAAAPARPAPAAEKGFDSQPRPGTEPPPGPKERRKTPRGKR